MSTEVTALAFEDTLYVEGERFTFRQLTSGWRTIDVPDYQERIARSATPWRVPKRVWIGMGFHWASTNPYFAYRVERCYDDRPELQCNAYYAYYCRLADFDTKGPVPIPDDEREWVQLQRDNRPDFFFTKAEAVEALEPLHGKPQ